MPNRTQRPEDKAKDVAPPERVDIEVPPRPMRTLGLVMKMGKITAVQANSPAAEAGHSRPATSSTAIDGQPPGDPMRLPEHAAPPRRADDHADDFARWSLGPR